MACSRSASSAIFAFTLASIRCLVFFVIVRSVYQTAALHWLSRDEREVHAYVADPLCGFPFTTQLAIDVLDALPRVTGRESLARVRKDLPIYVFSGELDPVGANIQGLIADLKAAGFAKLTTRLYPGARHQTLNEMNRDEVTRDLIAWLDGVVGK